MKSGRDVGVAGVLGWFLQGDIPVNRHMTGSMASERLSDVNKQEV